MELKVYLYVFFTFMSVFIFNGINFNLIMKKNKVIEAKLLTNFVIDFIS